MCRKSFAVIAIVCGMALAAVASPHDSCRAESARGEKMAKELGLSTQQKSQLRELRKEMRDFHRSQMDKMRALRDKSKGELLAASPNKEILYGFAREMGELRRVMAEKEADHLLKVKAVLTPDQFEKLLKMDFGQRKGPGPAGCHDTLQGKWLHGRGPNGGPHHPDMED